MAADTPKDAALKPTPAEKFRPPTARLKGAQSVAYDRGASHGLTPQTVAYDRVASHSPPLIQMLALLPQRALQIGTLALAIAALLHGVKDDLNRPPGPLVFCMMFAALLQDIQGLTTYPKFECLADKTLLPVLVVCMANLVAKDGKGIGQYGPVFIGALALDVAAGSRVCIASQASLLHQICGLALIGTIIAVMADLKFRPEQPNIVPNAAIVLLIGVRALFAVGVIFTTLIADDPSTEAVDAAAPGASPQDSKKES